MLTNDLVLNQSRIMTRVMFLHRIKRAVSSWITKLSLVILFAVVGFSSVSISSVWSNMLAEERQFGRGFFYLLRAGFQTEFSVQLSFLGFALFSYLLFRNFVNFSPRRLLTFWRWRLA